jgi:cytochrome b561
LVATAAAVAFMAVVRNVSRNKRLFLYFFHFEFGLLIAFLSPVLLLASANIAAGN